MLLSLIAPRRAHLSDWIATYVVGLIVGVMLLITALVWREATGRFTAVSWSCAPGILGLAGVGALLVGLLGYCLYLAGIALRFNSRRLAFCFVAWFVALLLQAGLIALVEIIFVCCPQYWPAGIEKTWKQELYFCATGIALTMGVSWLALLWRLRRLLPRHEFRYEPDED